MQACAGQAVLGVTFCFVFMPVVFALLVDGRKTENRNSVLAFEAQHSHSSTWYGQVARVAHMDAVDSVRNQLPRQTAVKSQIICLPPCPPSSPTHKRTRTATGTVLCVSRGKMGEGNVTGGVESDPNETAWRVHGVARARSPSPCHGRKGGSILCTSTMVLRAFNVRQVTENGWCSACHGVRASTSRRLHIVAESSCFFRGCVGYGRFCVRVAGHADALVRRVR